MFGESGTNQKYGDEPNFLAVGTEVSAKYRGAFCEAKVKKIVRNVRCKITLKEMGGGSMVVQDEDLRGNVKTGLLCEVKLPDSGQYAQCVVNKVTDMSTYTVVFNDGDENTLRRTQLCLKGEKHFVKSDTLDELPLTNPEHFGTPVMRGSRSMKSKRMMHNASSSESDSDMDSSDDDLPPGRTRGRVELRNMIGHVICLEVDERKKTVWVPALVVQPTADPSHLKAPDHHLVKSFKDAKFYAVSKRAIKEFTRDMAIRNDDKMLKLPYEKALQYYDNHELPQSWDRMELLGSEDDEDEVSTDDDEPSEERDRFVAQLYKFMDDRGTPMNKSPQVSSRDLDLYKLFRLVQVFGGYNRVTNQMKWHVIYSKMNLPPPGSSSSNQLKLAYKKYLHAFEDFDRKLGCTMGTITRPRVKHTPGRSILSFRERESTPRSPRRKKTRDEEEEEVRSGKEVSDRSDVDSIKSDKLKTRLDMTLSVSDSEGDSTDGRPTTRDSSRSASRSLTRDDLRKAREEAQRIKEEERSKEDRAGPESDDKEEGRQPKKRSVRKKEGEDIGKDINKDDGKDDKKMKRRVKEETPSEQSEDKANSDDDDEPLERMGRSRLDYEVGMKLRIKYGKGKTIKIYEAKLVEVRQEGSSTQYKVHYAGWNIRYDEWIRKDRIVNCVDDPATKVKVIKPQPKTPALPPAKSKIHTPAMKKLVRKPPVTPAPPGKDKEKEKDTTKTAVKALVPQTPGGGKNKNAVTSAVTKSPAPSAGSRSPLTSLGSRSPSLNQPPKPTPAMSTPSSSKMPRPTRSTSTESTLAIGLPAKRRPRRYSGMADDTQASDTDNDESESSEEEEEVTERVTRSRRDVEVKPRETAESSSENKKTEPAATVKPQKDTPTEVKDEVKEEDISDSDDKPLVRKPPAAVRATDATRLKESRVDRTIEEVVASAAALEDHQQEEEIKQEKKIDEKIYDFEDSSSQDSFIKGGPLVRTPLSDSKEVTERGRFSKRKEAGKRTRAPSSDSVASNDSVVKPTPVKPDRELPEPTKTAKDTLRSGKKVVEVKPEPERKTEPEKKKPGPKPKDNKDNGEEKAKPKAAAKAEKPRGKRKLETPEAAKVEEVEKKKMRRKKEVKEEDKVEVQDSPKRTPEVRDSPKRTPDVRDSPKRTPDVRSTTESSSSESPDKVETMSASEEPSWSPQYIPAPTLVQTVSIETKSERDVMDEPAPQLSPIASVSTVDTRVEHLAPPSELPPPIMFTDTGLVDPQALLFEDTPPDTPQGSPVALTTGETTPVQIEDDLSLKSGVDLLADIIHRAQPMGGESPSACNTSTVSNSSGGSSGNAPGSEGEEIIQTLKRAQEGSEAEDDLQDKPPSTKKRRKRQSKGDKSANQSSSKASVSDSDESEQMKSPESVRSLSMVHGMSPGHSIQRVPKYNFLDLEEGKYLEGEERIAFLAGKISDIRKIYMQLKSEVACIDRRRKRHRRKMNEAAATAAAAAAVAAVVDRGEAMMS